MTDMHDNFYANLYYQYTYGWRDFDITPYVQATYKNSSFNTYYYGLGAINTMPTNHLGAGGDLSLAWMSDTTLQAISTSIVKLKQNF